MKRAQVSAEFIGEAGQRIFVLAHHPEQFSGSCVLVCPAFAEEMNKSRRMLTELAQHLVQGNIGLVIPDLYGTGDSEGDYVDASVTRWMDDLAQTEKWVESRGWRIESILGIRFGCLLATNYAAKFTKPKASWVFWQPVLDGRKALDQFLRLRVAASLMADIKETVSSLKARIATDKTLEIAGYSISEQMAKEMEVLKLDDGINKITQKIHWFEVLRDADTVVPLPVEKTVEQVANVKLQTVVGDQFWVSTEITVNRELINKTTILLSDVGP